MLPYDQTNILNNLMTGYLAGNDDLKDFYKYPISLEAFDQVIKDKQKQPLNREVLADVLTQQYEGRNPTQQTAANIELLRKDTTFSITTAHQPNIFTGPLYFIYKIIDAINLAEQLRTARPAYDFVPVYWMGIEDHDFEEISYINLFGEKIQWQTDQSIGGPVGKMKPDLSEEIAQVAAKLGSLPFADEVVALLKRCYLESHNLEEATARLANELFGQYGLVVINQSDPALKKLLVEVIKDEICNQRVSSLVAPHIERLSQSGYKVQATPREINFFYTGTGMRNRIVKSDDQYQVLNTEISWSEEQLLREVDVHPEYFSPNVFLRPLYQELLLPNLAYVGGGGETSYWMELKPLFEHFAINYPMLVLRNSVLLLDGASQKKIKQLGIQLADLFVETDELIKQIVHVESENDLNLNSEKAELEALYKSILDKATEIDPTLKGSVEGVKQGQLKALQGLEQKMVKAEKRKFDETITKIKGLKARIFPEGNLQERHENFSGYYAKYGPQFLEGLKSNLDPLDQQLTILELR